MRYWARTEIGAKENLLGKQEQALGRRPRLLAVPGVEGEMGDDTGG